MFSLKLFRVINGKPIEFMSNGDLLWIHMEPGPDGISDMQSDGSNYLGSWLCH